MPQTIQTTHRRASRARRGELGAGGVKLFISLIFLALLAHTAYVFIPVYIAVYDFDSQVEREANYGATKTNEVLVKSLLDYAAERHLPLKKENMKVARGQSRITVDISYSVPVKTLFYTYDWKIDVKKEAVLF